MKKEIVTCDRCGAVCTAKHVDFVLVGRTRRDLCPTCADACLTFVTNLVVERATDGWKGDTTEITASTRLRAYLAELHEQWANGATVAEVKDGILHAMNIARQIP